MDDLSDPQDEDGEPDQRQAEEPEEPRYLGLAAWQLNFAFFAVVGAIALAALVFLGGAGAVGDLFGGDEPSRSTATVARATPTPAPTEPAPEDGGSTVAGTDPADDGGSDAVASVLGAVNPLSLVGALGSGGLPQLDDAIGGAQGDASQQDGSLSAALLRQGDLPAGFQTFGEMTFSMPVEGVSAEMAMTMFGTADLASGDLPDGDFGTMVVSAVIESSELAATGFDLESAGLSEADLAEVQDGMTALGISVSDLQILNASGLGEQGFGMHMEMDFSELLSGFGDLTAGGDFPTSMAWDMYGWLRGDRMYMVMVIWAGGDSGVDARALADLVEGRAAGG